MDKLKQQRSTGALLVHGVKEPAVTVKQTKWTAENALRKAEPVISISDRMAFVVKREFDKFRAAQAL